MAGPDGRLRCPWGLSTPDYVAYHDTEWGRPVRGDQAIFERLCLEAFQSGLSWLTILRKRENFRKAFAGFDIQAVAAFTDATWPGCSPTRASCATAPRSTPPSTTPAPPLELTEGLSDLVWGYADAASAPGATSPWPTSHRRRQVKTAGQGVAHPRLRFTGPVTVYAAMQACGLVNDHLDDCFARGINTDSHQ